MWWRGDGWTVDGSPAHGGRGWEGVVRTRSLCVVSNLLIHACSDGGRAVHSEGALVADGRREARREVRRGAAHHLAGQPCMGGGRRNWSVRG